jgi:hypothetical protein
MAVRLLTDRAGVSFVQREGDVVELSPEIESQLVAAGQAEAVDNNPADDAPADSADQFQTKRQRNRRR